MRKTIFFLLIALLVSACGEKNITTMIDTPVKTEAPHAKLPTPTKVDDMSFSLNSLNTTLPDDVIKEIAYYGGQGGSGHPCESAPGLVKHLDFTQVELMQGNSFYACNIPIGKVLVRVTDPLGNIQESTEQSRNNRGLGKNVFGWGYAVDVTQPIGQYTFYFSGEGWDFTQKVDVHNPETPHLYVDREMNRIILWRFQSNEQVRLLFYQPGLESKGPDASESKVLRGWQNYQVNAAGNLIIHVDFKSFKSLDEKRGEFYAVGNISGQVKSLPKGWDWMSNIGIQAIADVFCGSGSQSLGLHANDYVKVLVTNFPAAITGIKWWDHSNDLRTDILNTLPKGTILKIKMGPVCHEGTFWWEVKCVTGKTCDGLIAEKNGNTPNLQVLAALPPTPTFDPSNIPACPGAKPTRLRPGGQAKVSKIATQLSLREKPDAQAKKIHVIASGRKMSILDEPPVCANNAYWWHVYVDELNFGGWAREGDHEDYWIDPLP